MVVAASVIGSLGLVTAHAVAQPAPAGPGAGTVEDARPIADRGYELFKQGDYAAAIELFQQAEKISHSPVIVAFIAEGLERLGRLIEATTYYQQVADEQLPDRPPAPEPVRKAVADAKAKLPVLKARIPKVTVELSNLPPSGAQVTLDQRPLSAEELAGPISVDPGQHALVIKVEGSEPVTRVFEAAERTSVAVTQSFGTITKEVPVAGPVRTAPEKSIVHVVGPSVSYGVGVAGVALGVVTGILYLNRASDLKDRCPDGRCIAELESEKDAVSQLGTAATIGFAVGGAGLVAGTLWLLFAPDPESEPEGDDSAPATGPEGPAAPAAALQVGPTGLAIVGVF